MRYGCLDSAEVYESGSSSCIASRKKARHSRSEDTRSVTIRLEHYPTGIAVQGSTPMGNYPRKELARLRKELRIELWKSLESQVARALRLPRR